MSRVTEMTRRSHFTPENGAPPKGVFKYTTQIPGATDASMMSMRPSPLTSIAWRHTWSLEPWAKRHELPARVAYQDACHLGHAQGIRDAPREVLRSVPGLELVEPAEQAICCGSAGIYNLVQPEAAAELGERKAANVAATGAEVYASANPGCLVQVSTYLRRSGRPLPALHPVELLDASLRGLGPDKLLAGARR